MKNTSIVLIAVIAAVVISSALPVTMTSTAFAEVEHAGGHNHQSNGVNDGSGGPGNSDFGHSHDGANGGETGNADVTNSGNQQG